MLRLAAVLVLALSLLACPGGPSDSPAPAPAPEASSAAVDGAADPEAALTALLAEPYATYFADPAQHSAASARINGAIERAMNVSERAPDFAALQVAASMLTVNPTPGAYSTVQREWGRIRP